LIAGSPCPPQDMAARPHRTENGCWWRCRMRMPWGSLIWRRCKWSRASGALGSSTSAHPARWSGRLCVVRQEPSDGGDTHRRLGREVNRSRKRSRWSRVGAIIFNSAHFHQYRPERPLSLRLRQEAQAVLRRGGGGVRIGRRYILGAQQLPFSGSNRKGGTGGEG
jgi:hypothetical protein